MKVSAKYVKWKRGGLDGGGPNGGGLDGDGLDSSDNDGGGFDGGLGIGLIFPRTQPKVQPIE